jgi:hypothetical protein
LDLFAILKKSLGLACVLLLCTTVFAAPPAKAHRKSGHKRSTVSKTAKAVGPKTRSASVRSRGKHSRRTTPKTARARGQQAIDADRTREIQHALIRANYLQGEPNGVWDQRTKEALTRFQQDNGWQSKVVPDSRALIKLGLGPRQANLINPVAPTTFTSRADRDAGHCDMPTGSGELRSSGAQQ